jgi:hypothetical protein
MHHERCSADCYSALRRACVHKAFFNVALARPNCVAHDYTDFRASTAVSRQAHHEKICTGIHYALLQLQ